MAAFTSIASGNWNDGPTTWGTGAGVYPGASAAGDTVVIADTHAVALNVSPAFSIATITNTGNGGYITVGGAYTLTLTGSTAITYSGTSTSGLIRVGTGGNLTITHNQGAGTTAVKNTAAGRAIVTSSNGILTVSNSGGTAVDNSGSASGYGISHDSTGALTITGAVVGTHGNVVRVTGASTNAITGDIATSGGSVLLSAGTTTIDGHLSGYSVFGAGGSPVVVAGGTLIWTGSRSVDADTDERILLSSGTANLSSLVLTISGRFGLNKIGGTLNVGSGGTLAQFILQSASAQCTILGQAVTVTGPTIPTEEDVELGVEYGYVGDLQTGTLVAGGGTSRAVIIGG